MSIFEDEKLINKLEEFKGEVLELCKKFPVYK
jgi:hypothetical protein